MNFKMKIKLILLKNYLKDIKRLKDQIVQKIKINIIKN